MGTRAFYSLLLLLLLSVCSDEVFSQNGDKDEKKLDREAEEYFEDGDYNRALPLYLELYAAHPKNPMYNFCLGVTYLALSPNKTKNISKERAIPHLEFAKQTLQLIDTEYYLGLAYHLNYQWDKAVIQYQDYLDALAMYEPYYLTPLLQKKEEFRRIERQIEMCHSGKLLMQDTTDIIFENLGSKVNSSYPDYAPAISADNEVLIFTSRRPPLNGKGKMDEDYLYYEDIFITYKKNGQWVDAIPISQNINTKKHNASIGFSADAQTLFVYEDGDIYMSELDGEMWTIPVKLGKAINTPAWETHITMTSAQNTIYFVSDRKGGYGGRDIYKAHRMKDGSWGRVENLGPTVNTPYDEDAPFIHPDERHLYFSSNGHNSMGGFDVFYTKLQEGKWSNPVNMGYPINTPGDDIYFTVSSNGKTGYLSTIREEGLGGTDIFIATMPDTGQVALTVIRGLIKGMDNKALTADFVVTDKNTNELIGRYRSNSVSGKYLLTLPPGRDYNVVIIADEYVRHCESISIPKQDRFYDLFQEIQLTHVIRRESDETDSVIGQQVIVRNAFFDIDSVVAVADRALKAVDEKELAYSYFLGNLEKSSPEERKVLSDEVEPIIGVGTKVAEYKPTIHVHITETATNDDLERYILGYDTVYATSIATSTKIDADKLAQADLELEEAYYVSREMLESAEYNPEEYFTTKGLKEGVEELFKDDTTSEESGEALVMNEEETITDETSTESKESDMTEANVDITDLTNKNSTLLIVYFGINSSILDKAPREALDKLYTLLSKDLNMVVGISGHTCNIGDAAYNVMLSNARAQSVMAYLVEKGIADKRLKAVGYGETKPITSNNTRKGRILNRRAELKLSDVTGKPIDAEISFAESGTNNNLAIAEAAICKSVKDRVPIEPGVSFSSSVKRLYFFTKVTSSDTKEGTITHIWYYKDKKMAEIPLSYKGPHWRTYSSKWIVASWTGAWRVEVVTEHGQVIKSTSFTVE
jgi:outer membrane protein OmpA-like peptidoglycan-associated protein/tetratricopeptide (TPR) repeat protein